MGDITFDSSTQSKVQLAAKAKHQQEAKLLKDQAKHAKLMKKPSADNKTRKQPLTSPMKADSKSKKTISKPKATGMAKKVPQFECIHFQLCVTPSNDPNITYPDVALIKTTQEECLHSFKTDANPNYMSSDLATQNDCENTQLFYTR